MKKNITISIDKEIYDDLNPFLIDRGKDLKEVMETYINKFYTLKKEEIDLWNKKQEEDFLK